MAVPSSSHYDVFLSHNSVDKPRVEDLARQLKQVGIEPFLDKWNLIPGQPWQEALQEALIKSAACAVFIGPGGFSPWQHEEVMAAIEHRVAESRGGYRVIPVLLPGASRPGEKGLPPFLLRTTWVKFSRTLDDAEEFHHLVCGIRGLAPGPGPGQAIFEGECPYRGLQVFEEKHARFFFGREAQVDWLLSHRLAPMAESSHATRFQAILGPSGSGKSSLALAGLIPALKGGKGGRQRGMADRRVPFRLQSAGKPRDRALSRRRVRTVSRGDPGPDLRPGAGPHHPPPDCAPRPARSTRRAAGDPGRPVRRNLHALYR